MTEHDFWRHIEQLKGVSEEAAYKKRLRVLFKNWPALDILRFGRHLDAAMMRAKQHSLWGAAMLLNGGRCGDDAFRKFRCWLVARGQAVFEQAMIEPDSLADVPVPLDKNGRPHAQLQGLRSTPEAVLMSHLRSEADQERFFQTVPAEERAGLGEEDIYLGFLYWAEPTNAELTLQFPKLWAKYAEFKLLRDNEPREPDEDFSHCLREVEIPGLGHVCVGDTLFQRGSEKPIEVLAIEDSALHAAQFGGGDFLGGDESRYMGRVREAGCAWSHTKSLSPTYLRRVDQPDQPDLVQVPAIPLPEIESEDEVERICAIEARIRAALGEKVFVVYSAYAKDSAGLPIDNLDEVAYVGSIRFLGRGSGEYAPQHASAALTNPTWLDLARVANEMIKASGDFDHCYLEGFDVASYEQNVAIGVLWMGS